MWGLGFDEKSQRSAKSVTTATFSLRIVAFLSDTVSPPGLQTSFKTY